MLVERLQSAKLIQLELQSILASVETPGNFSYTRRILQTLKQVKSLLLLQSRLFVEVLNFENCLLLLGDSEFKINYYVLQPF